MNRVVAWTNDGEPALPLADDFFLVVLDDRTGRFRLRPRVAALGLAGCLLAELIFAGNITLDDGRLVILDQPPAEEPLARRTLGLLLSEPDQVLVREWLLVLAETVIDLVAQRLTQAGLLTIKPARGIRIRNAAVTYQPTDISEAAWRAVRLASLLAGRRSMTWPDVTLLGLVCATEFLQAVLWNSPRDVCLPYLAEALQSLQQTHPQLYELVTHVQALVGHAVLSHRT